MPGRAARQLVLLEQDDIAAAQLRQVVGEAAPGDPAPDDRDLGFRHHVWDHQGEGGNHERDHRRPRDNLLRGLRALPESRLHAPGRLRRAARADQHRPCKRLDARREPVHLRRDGRDHPRRAAAARGLAGEGDPRRLHDDRLRRHRGAEHGHGHLAPQDPGRGAAARGRTPSRSTSGSRRSPASR